jgi:AcrR family transcriptional regulator
MTNIELESQEKAKCKKRIPKEDRREQILLIASEIFSQKGFNGATTKEIADTAGVSEAIIFRHFPNKQALYSAILDNKTTEMMQPLWLKCEELMLKKDDHAVFITLATQILEIIHDDPTLLRLLFYSALEKHQLAKDFAETTVRQVREPAVTYINQRIKDGDFRIIDPVLAAQFFFSLVMQWAIGRDLLQDSTKQLFSSKKAAREITNIFLSGISKNQNILDLKTKE